MQVSRAAESCGCYSICHYGWMTGKPETIRHFCHCGTSHLTSTVPIGREVRLWEVWDTPKLLAEESPIRKP